MAEQTTSVNMRFAPEKGYSDENVLVTDLGNDNYDYMFLIENALVVFENLQETSRGLISTLTIECPPQHPIVSHIQTNLYSQKARRDLAIELAKTYLDEYLPWDKMLEYAITDVIQRIKEPPELSDISQDPQDTKVRYLLEPLLVINLPNTLFSPGGKGKTIMANYVAVLITHGIAASNGLPFIPIEAKVLYLDYEADIETHRRYVTAIERGLGLPHKPIYYMNIDQPLTYYIGFLLDLIKQHDIGLVIVDSMMAATALDTSRQTEAQVASAYYNLLRSLGCTTLTLDHTTKQNMLTDDNAVAPYGSIVKFNRSRSQWELKSSQQVDDDTMEIALTDRKFNLGKPRPSIGVRIKFNNDGDELLSVEFSPCDISDNPALSKVLPLKIRIKDLLLDAGDMTISEIAEALSADYGSVKAELYRSKSLFTQVDKRGKAITWGVVENEA